MERSLRGGLYAREVFGTASGRPRLRALYGDSSLVGALDIVNELGGHSGCVNALSWSQNGRLLASGSDDQHLNIYEYQPPGCNSQFQLATTVATGHTQNIFSVKFMPHHNDRVVVTAAGDGEVRIFDLEHTGRTRIPSNASTRASQSRRRGRTSVFDGVRYLSDGDTDCRVYRSHGDRVKRIVTESSPYLFLTCSESGEVRQWDLRQPSSTYPAPRAGRMSSVLDVPVPPPLISYQRYGLDLNTISCSASQPHYIALGGAHLHAFLHDRRMTGRDRLREAGRPLSPIANMSPTEQELMRQATQCVRKFAPQGQKKMKRTETGHITACKISDARPDEMVVSWSGDHIYSFDLIRSPDETEEEALLRADETEVRSKHDRNDRKRKRVINGSDVSLGRVASNRASSRQRTSSPPNRQNNTALRIRYGNGQTEDLPISAEPANNIIESLDTPAAMKARLARRVARATLGLRCALFKNSRGLDSAEQFTDALGHAASILSDVDEAMRSWTYPLDPSPGMVSNHRSLRHKRERVRRLIQTGGVLARVLGGRLQTPSGTSPMMAQFATVEVKHSEMPLTPQEQFGYDFIKAILLWLESGVGTLIEGFTRPSAILPGSRSALRVPIDEADASIEVIDEVLIPYLLQLASDKPVTDIEVNRFEVGENRILFASEKAAVLAFARAVRTPFADLAAANDTADDSAQVQFQERQGAVRFWGLQVARGILLSMASGVNFNFVLRAFGGNGERSSREASAEDSLIEPLEIRHSDESDVADSTDSERPWPHSAEVHESAAADELGNADESTEEEGHNLLQGSGNSDGPETDEEDDSDTENETSSSDPDEEDGVPNLGLPRIFHRSAFERRRLRERVEANVPCSAYMRKYEGHCNVKTVKDVNYFGLDDEYVVSGSDDGNFFIWDRKTSELINVLEGDGEVVNVVQGHPYETMLAVSGIDHTIKIFSPDARAREAARLGNGVSAHDSSSFSSLNWRHQTARTALRRHRQDAADSNYDSATRYSELGQALQHDSLNDDNDDHDDHDDDHFVAPTGLRSRQQMHNAYAIMTNNDVERQGVNQEATITLPDARLLQLLFGHLGNIDGPIFRLP